MSQDEHMQTSIGKPSHASLDGHRKDGAHATEGNIADPGVDMQGSNMIEPSNSMLGSHMDYNKKRGYLDVENAFRKPMFPANPPSATPIMANGGQMSSMLSQTEHQMTQVVWGTNINTSDIFLI